MVILGSSLHRENRENGSKKGKHWEFGNFAKTGNLLCLSSKLP